MTKIPVGGETELPPEGEALLEAARAVQSRAYAPYSRFLVAAALRDENGMIHVGVNVENAAYPNGTCAETAAITAMVTAGAREIAAIAIVGGKGDFCPPCGACRQRIREFARPSALIFLSDENSQRRVHTLGELLPESFGPAHLLSNS
ncbi:cytidine deaminase [Roseibacillus ishigakijimensis]|uniref:Cytidine deaminase n=1 Tax=Roseibacillus ishigakijimensis TaxID=454146 RepID=A0A934VM64_9BACT|nr:cytidine deaminase [Roseibacillus ishigakijimensis]MBK1833630.1 cytidine deaminase [Roseibacillus ishigakijimensis]